MSSTNAINQLNSYLIVFASIVKELVPASYAIEYIENKAKLINERIESFTPLHDKLWDNLEIVLKTDTTAAEGYIKGFYGHFEEHFRLFHEKYTTKTNRQFPAYINQFKLPLAQYNLSVFFGMAEHDFALLSLFYSHFALSFPILQYDEKPNIFINHASPVSIQLFEKLKRAKSEWDRLPDYKRKLWFWFKQGLQIDERTYHVSEDINDLEGRISIYPETNEEKVAWKHFYFEKFNKYNFNTLETSKADYNTHIDDGADPIPYTKAVIEQIDKEYANHDKIRFNNTSDYCEGYKASQNGQVKKYLDSYILPHSMRDFCTGIVHEKYKRFLKEQLQKLELSPSNNSATPTNLQAQKIYFEFEYFLRQYIDIALRWQISKNSISALKWYYENARTKWEKFKQEYRHHKRNFNEIEKGNFYDDLVNDFYPMIDAYIVFYNSNKGIIRQNVSDNINVYSVLLDLCIDSKKEIEILNVRKTVASAVKSDETATPIQDNKIITPVKTYSWNVGHNTLKTLYRLLKEESCIAEDTPINSFLFIFSGKPECKIWESIKWLKSNRLLAYFLFLLRKSDIINDTEWQSVAGKGIFFVTPKNKPIKANDLSKATSDCNKFVDKPQKSEIIDRILATIISKR